MNKVINKKSLAHSLVVSFMVPLTVSADTFREIVENDILPFIGIIVQVIISITVIIILWNGVQMILHADNAQKKADSRSSMLWSIIVLFVMVSMWAIIGIFRTALNV